MNFKDDTSNNIYPDYDPAQDDILSIIASPYDDDEAEQSREKIFGLIEKRITEQSAAAPVKTRKLKSLLKIAAVLALLAGGVAYSFYELGYRAGIDRLCQTQVTTESPAGGMITLTLPDSTGVTLNSSSKITYPSRFDAKQRRVSIDGEAYFDVRKDRAPFIVETSAGVEVEVLGTRFNLKAFGQEDHVWLTLVEGSVAVNVDTPDNSGPVTISPNEQFVMDKATGAISVEEVHTGFYTYWTTGSLSFNNSTLEEIMMALEGRFGVEILISNPRLRGQTYYSQFSKDDSLERILSLLSNKGNWKYRLEGGTVTIF